LITCPILLIPVPFLTYSLFKLLTGKKERIFEEKFGEEYIEYGKNVNSLIPRLNKRYYKFYKNYK
jgi:protein-S-isoprenylcysteine O-methyltransferase Ste14